MKLVYGLFKIIAVAVIVITVALFSASYFLQDKIAGIILKSFNEKISTRYDFGSLKLSFLRKFPNANLDLKNVLVHSSPGFDTSCFTDVNTDTLLAAKSVSLEFRITDIIKGIYNIEKIGIREGRLILLTDTAGKVNYRISPKSSQPSEKEFRLNLDRVTLHEIDATFSNLATRLDLRGFIGNGRLKSSITGKTIDFNADASLRIDLFKLYDFKVSQSISTVARVSLHDSGHGVFFDESTISFDGYNFSISGSITTGNVLDLKLSGGNIDISGIRNYLPEKYNVMLSEYNPSGTLNVVSRITGTVSSSDNPGIEISAKLENGSVSYLNSALSIGDLSLDCIFNNGIDHKPASSYLAINNFRGRLGSAGYSGSFCLEDFDNPRVIINLDGRVIPSELTEFFSLKEVAWAEGSIDLSLRMQGLLPKERKYTARDFLRLDPVSKMHLNYFGIGLKKKNRSVSQVNGDILLGDSIAAENLSFKFRDHSFNLNGIFMNLPEWLSGDPVILTGNAKVSCMALNPATLFPSSFSKDTSVTTSTFTLPGDVVMDLVFSIDELTYGRFNAAKVNGAISYKPRILNFKSLSLNSLDGFISGNGFIVQNTDKSFVGRSSWSLEDIDVKKTFSSFNNFGQEFIKAENLDGNLSGTVSLLMPMENSFKPVMRSLTAEGRYTLTAGSLLNFEPVKSLSSFIELAELENIRFEKLENDFFIRNNILYIPQMDIISSAADFTVSGQHGFNNDYEYHIRILLSELLSRKLKKPKPGTTEFGAVKDDGLGRTSLVLRIEDKGDDVRVVYDAKAAGASIKNNIRAERKNLRTILNQEYGWFKSDTVTTETRPAGTPRFKISWDEADTVKSEAETPVKRENPIKNLFRKR